MFEDPTKYTLEDIKIMGEKPRMGIELDGRSYEVEVNLTGMYDSKIAKTTAYYRELGQCLEVENWTRLEELHDIFMERYEKG